MCGIVSILRSGEKPILQRDVEDMFSDMLYADALRGFDSTGVFLAGKYTNDTDVELYKRALEARDFLNTRVFKRLMNKCTPYDFLVGHNRSATLGKVQDEMAHPFMYKNVVGVHNGTLTGHNKLTSHGVIHESDSEALYHAINDCPPGEPDEILEKVTGAFALVWYDKRNGKLYAIRNTERPLFIIPVKDKGSVVLSSEFGLGKWILGRYGYDVDKSFGMCTDGVLYQFDRHSPKKWEEREIKLMPKEEKWQKNNQYWNDYYKYSNGKKQDGTSGKKEEDKYQKIIVGSIIKMKVTKKEVIPDSNGKRVLIHGYCQDDPWPTCVMFIQKGFGNLPNPDEIKKGDILRGRVDKIKETPRLSHTISLSFREYLPEGKALALSNKKDEKGVDINTGKRNNVTVLFYGPDKKPMTKKEWDEATKEGCAYCGTNVTDDMVGKIGWTPETKPLCPTCIEDLEIEPNGVYH